MKFKYLVFALLILVFSGTTRLLAWGFYAHKKINRLAVFTLPPEMITFYKYYLNFIEENAVNPDKRRYAVDGEAPRHYIDIDAFDHLYNDSAVYKMPRYWSEAVDIHSEDTLMAYGIAPWHVNVMKYRLTEAMRKRDALAILRLSADIGHYIADSNVPLHTTINYNGQLTNQIGIHAFWESRLPELYADNYNFFVGKAEYIENPQLEAWKAVTNAHLALDSVLAFERELSQTFSLDRKYTLEERNALTIRTYSRPFCQTYHQKLNGQVERRMRASIKMIGDFWYTCWIDAGQPDLKQLLDQNYAKKLQKELEEQRKQWEKELFESRPHESFSTNPPAPAKHKGCCAPSASYFTYYLRKKK